jgi:hypothetical protein
MPEALILNRTQASAAGQYFNSRAAVRMGKGMDIVLIGLLYKSE